LGYDAEVGAAEDAWHCMCRLVNEGEQEDRVGSLSRSTGLTPGMMRAVVRLRRAGTLTMRELARALGCDPSYVTSIVDELATRELAQRVAHEADRRVKLVVLTGDGVRTADEILSLLAVPPRSFGALDPRERRLLRELLTKLLEAEAAGSAPPRDAVLAGGRRVT
jgi:DNA-binding MarR family transcriptional regulator